MQAYYMLIEFLFRLHECIVGYLTANFSQCMGASPPNPLMVFIKIFPPLLQRPLRLVICKLMNVNGQSSY